MDVAPTSPHVLKLDVRRTLPFSDNELDVVYHSHLLEHLGRDEAVAFIAECRRVLRSGGVMRVVVPDLEGIAAAYLSELKAVADGGDNTLYEWLRLELTDQLARENSGGDMVDYVSRLSPGQLMTVQSRIGSEASSILAMRRASRRVVSLGRVWLRFRREIGRILLYLLGGRRMMKAFDVGWFRQSGEVHRVMYDYVSLGRLLRENGFDSPALVGPTESRIPNFMGYELDAVAGLERKPDSLYMEVVRA